MDCLRGADEVGGGSLKVATERWVQREREVLRRRLSGGSEDG